MSVKYADPKAQQPQGVLDLTVDVEAGIQPNALFMLDSRDKTEAVACEVRRLIEAGYKIYGSAGTAKFLNELGLATIDLEAVTGHKPAMNHRMASFSWKVACGLISDQGNPEHCAYLDSLGIPTFQLLVCTVYGLGAEMRNPDSTWRSRLEKTDFGGPSGAAAASKGRRAIVLDINKLTSTVSRLIYGKVTPEWLEEMAAEAYHFCAHYQGLAAANVSQGSLKTISLEQVADLRRGENPYETDGMLMRNAFGHDDPLAIDKLRVVGDIEPGWVNWVDLDRAQNTLTTLAAVADINRFATAFPYCGVVVKHGNPVGLALGNRPEVVLEKTLTGNQQAAFGGIAMFNFAVSSRLADMILHDWLPTGIKFRYLVGIAAPSFSTQAKHILRGKTIKKLLLANPALANLDRNSVDTSPKWATLRGCALTSNGERYLLDFDDPRLTWTVADGGMSHGTRVNLMIAFAACATSISNTTSCANNSQLVGNGVGQQDRVGSCELAMKQAGDRADGSAVVTDSFFPAKDGPEDLANHGVYAIMCTTGSRADDEVRQLIEQRQIHLITIPDQDGRIFFGHK